MHSPRPRSPVNAHGSSIGLGHPTARRKSGLRSRGTQILALRFGWVVLVIWYEVGEFFSSLSSCKFPDSALRQNSQSRRYSNQPAVHQPTHIVLLADPHVPHPRLSYSPDSNPWVNFLKQGMDELFMRKSWNVVMRLGRVDAVVIVGDMLDWGRGVMGDQEYESYIDLFHSIFQLPSSIPMYYVPGNHDLPLGPNRLFSPHARDRYATHFSPPNAVLEIANHSLILLDAVGLVEEDYRRYAAEMQFGEWDGVEGGVIEFVKSLGDDPPPGPKILVSHIPLARAEASRCGPLRERGRILKGAGPGYQNLLGSETTKFLLDAIGPSVIFSGDDHDYCEHIHPGGIREVTLKSFSSSAGIQRPGFQLLSLVPPTTSTSSQITHADRPCFLPDQAGVYYTVYIPLILLTIIYLFGTNIRATYQRWAASSSHNEKIRASPAITPSGETSSNASTTARRLSERPVPLTLPSRKSSQHLNGLTALTPTTATPRGARLGPAFGAPEHLTPRGSYSASAPASPQGSPRFSHFDDPPSYSTYSQHREDDMESVIESETPNISRRSSFIYMNGGNSDTYHTATPLSIQEPSSYFLPIPGSTTQHNSGLGLSTSSTPGYATQSDHVLRRASSSNLSNHYHSSTQTLPSRRTTMPRLLTTTDWSAAAKAKDKTLLGLMVDSLPVPGVSKGNRGKGGMGGGWREWWSGIRGFVRWFWKARNGVVGKSWREVLAVAWPAGVVWVVVNGLFFVG